MKILTDKSFQFRTYPVMPRKRIKFDPDTPVEFSEFGSEIPAFKCLGGYFTHQSYRLMDYFVSHWFEVARRNWTAKFGGQYPEKFSAENLDMLKDLSPILSQAGKAPLDLENDLVGLCQTMKDYVEIASVSDRDMRSHPSLKGISSGDLKRIIERTARARLKINYSVRTIKKIKKKWDCLGFTPWSNLRDDQPFYEILDYRLLDEVKGTDGRILERIYKFGFKGPLGLAMIHNTICNGFWYVNPALYKLSADAQLLYRYLVITGARRKNHAAEFLCHRLAWRERQKSRIINRLEMLFDELHKAGLIESYKKSRGLQYRCLFSYQLPGEKKKRMLLHDRSGIRFNQEKNRLNPGQTNP